MIGRAFAWLRSNPALGLAAAGVGAVLILPALRSAPATEDDADSAAAAAGPSPYMPVLAGSDLATADVANAVREGNALIVNQNSQLANALIEGQRTEATAAAARHDALTAILNRPPASATPPPANPPAAPPATPTGPVPTQAPPTPRISDATAAAILRSMGAPSHWLTNAKGLSNAAGVFRSEAEFRAWVIRAATSHRSYRVVNGRVVRA